MNHLPAHDLPLSLSGRGVTAVLGPTNTGKTHLAIERMLSHGSGMIGLPLRLLAREVYNRVVEKVGAANVSLITGEEKITPPGSRYSVCTVEAMPRRTDMPFVAIDEVQLAGDLERGHIFTDRILHLRGRQETLLLGAGTMRGILEKLLRGITVVTRPRLSHLSYAGAKKIIRLPNRSAIVAFSADEVYAIAELIRRQRGGAAVVMGALSPRTRNAQVELYQSGDVDFLVATDAIGMGLNLDVDHVAFAQNRKFDGYQFRDLTPAEVGQVAGRAGRHLRDGTFGVTGQVQPMDDELVERVEAHAFDPVKVLQWRTGRFDFSSLGALRYSLETPTPIEGLTKALPAVDQQALEYLSKDEDIVRLATTPARIELLWDTCALPDYRKIAPAQHADIIGTIYQDLVRRGSVDEDYMSEQVRRADSTEGEIDTLSHRVAQIRTWTFVSHRPGWLADPTHWQEKTREIEDRLSDALHERLTKRFVDRRTSVLMRRLRENAMLEAEISPAGDVIVEGHNVGQLEGFRFTADVQAEGPDAKAVKTAAQKALAAEFERRAERFAAAPNGDFALGSDGVMRWVGATVATLVAGDDVLKPRAIILADEQLTGPARDKVAARIERFVAHHIETILKPLTDLSAADALTGMTRGLAFQIVEGLGILQRREVAEEVRGLDQDSRAALRRLGVRFGAYHVFMPMLLKPAPAGLITLLWALKNDGRERAGYGDVVNVLAAGRTSVVVDPTFDPMFYRLGGYRVLGRRAVRIDILERLADLIRPALAWRPGSGVRPEGAYDGGRFIVTPAMMSILGATGEDMEEILKSLGYRHEAVDAANVAAKLAELDAFAAEVVVKDTVFKAAAPVAVANEGEKPAVPAAEPVPAPVEAVVAETVEEAKPAAEANSVAELSEAPAEEPKPVLLWRQGRFEGRSRNQDQNRQRHNRPQQGGQGNEAHKSEGGSEGGEAQNTRDNRGGGKRFDKNRRNHDGAGQNQGQTPGQNQGQNKREGFKGKPRDGDRNRQPKRDNASQQGNKRFEQERPVRVDPDSPFAKLLALKEQMKK
ncbi:helicase-related protein [Brucella rhizosphaerae]|uniref:Helicase domain protein n=1 Tax=Brucella rhizosphaerae TaxID=571254 RepID=A0A256F8T2_9HYPH|nr:helicase-related protein [Brucella rhizosphaerae]OYR11289.1 helicase domain protein [Brucella rhizosphaerae]